jgi:hypothetical protein
MAFGLEVRNTTNNLVVDLTYRNLSLQQKYDFNIGAGVTFSIVQTNCDAPLMAINASGYVGFYGLGVSGSTYTWRFKSSEASVGSVYIFDKPHSAHTSTFGMKVMAADGTTEIFNSDNKYLRVVDVLDVPWTGGADAISPQVTGPTATKTGLASAKYAVCASMSRVRAISLGNNNFRRIFDGVKSDTTSVSVSQVIAIDFFAGGGGEHPGHFAVSGSGTTPALIINVEGF